jgi:hypothetical protein
MNGGRLDTLIVARVFSRANMHRITMAMGRMVMRRPGAV